jgi:hypothetical protein
LNKLEKMLGTTTSHEEEREWIRLSWDLCKVREKEMAAVENHIDTDEFIPNLIIKDNGQSDHVMTEEENGAFAHKLAMCSALRTGASEDEKKIEPRRSNIAGNLFGKLDKYMNGGSYSRLLSLMKD